ncbi:hypothetical protein EYF80_022302 [Liparis tanakae]|uniref:Uncharacterized protein n=1 Tax=Liparis tanakae TaxID=230148 RepID=A0A4Z2HNP3_9TELE|nr:hypothetical protein EYF80_022302 [Liparis tanakae]
MLKHPQMVGVEHPTVCQSTSPEARPRAAERWGESKSTKEREERGEEKHFCGNRGEMTQSTAKKSPSRGPADSRDQLADWTTTRSYQQQTEAASCDPQWGKALRRSVYGVL